MIFYLIGLIIIIGIPIIARAKVKKQKEEKDLNNNIEFDEFDIEEIKKLIEEEPNTEYNYSECYQSRYLLTKNEWYAYKQLKEIADKKGYIICPKVRLLDIIEPRHGTKKYMSSLGKIQSKHIDFLICDQNLYIKAVLELDDNSHNRIDRIERDNFVNDILKSVGYKVIHTRGITENILDGIQ